MKVYIVQNSYGSYDDIFQSIDKIFDTPEKADKYVTEVKNRILELKGLYLNVDNIEHNENDDIYDKALKQFEVDFPDTHYDEWNGNYISIIEIDVE